MKLRNGLLFSLGMVLALVGPARSQYHFPVRFASLDSTNFSEVTRKFAGYVGVHLGSIPGFVHPQGYEFPRIQLYYQQGIAYTVSEARYNSNQTPLTNFGMFTALADLSDNLQVVLRYTPISLGSEALVLNGFGARYRTNAWTDTLHALTMGFLTQKLAGSDGFYLKLLDFYAQYGWFYTSGLLPMITYVTFNTSYISGKVHPEIYSDLGQQSRGFEHRILHGGVGQQVSWNQWSLGVELTGNVQTWNLMISAGWAIPAMR